mmetsp:Transcript_29677/g.69399  ORF Transcript_29677/g.69399 Transcript_29677/m.69399 type:complete len:210 (+) Transcript_29677:945-1574(+)
MGCTGGRAEQPQHDIAVQLHLGVLNIASLRVLRARHASRWADDPAAVRHTRVERARAVVDRQADRANCGAVRADEVERLLALEAGRRARALRDGRLGRDPGRGGEDEADGAALHRNAARVRVRLEAAGGAHVEAAHEARGCERRVRAVELEVVDRAHGEAVRARVGPHEPLEANELGRLGRGEARRGARGGGACPAARGRANIEGVRRY